MTALHGLAPDASTAATRADAWTQAEHNALASASRFDADARIAREQAGRLTDRPDMVVAATRLNHEATAAETTAESRRVLAHSYAQLRSLQEGGGGPAQGNNREQRAIEPPEPDDLEGDEDDDEGEDEGDGKAAEPEVYTTCYECEESLDKPTTREADSVHPECDPEKPPGYWMGALKRNGKAINQGEAEPYRRVKNLAADAIDMVLEWEIPYKDTYISLPDGSVVDAREWIERPENLELGGGLEQYAGRGEFDPEAPNRCWIGQTLPSGRVARPLARSFEDVAELAADVCKQVYQDVQGQRLSRDGTKYTVMLPGGELVDAYDWAQQPETRRVAGYTPVEFDPEAPGRCWLGKPLSGEGLVGPMSTSYEDVGELAADVCKQVYGNGRSRLQRDSQTVMLPGGEQVDAYDWAQQLETQRLAGYPPVEFDPEAPGRCWLGKPFADQGLVGPLSTSYDDVATMARDVCRAVFATHTMDHGSHTVMVPGGELVDAYNWAQQPETRRLARWPDVKNAVQFEATGTCRTCGASVSAINTQIVQGQVGQQVKAAAAIFCQACNKYLPAVFVPVTLVDDASAVVGAPPRELG